MHRLKVSFARREGQMGRVGQCSRPRELLACTGYLHGLLHLDGRLFYIKHIHCAIASGSHARKHVLRVELDPH